MKLDSISMQQSESSDSDACSEQMLPLKSIFTRERGSPGVEILSSKELPHHRPAARSSTTGPSPSARQPPYRNNTMVSSSVLLLALCVLEEFPLRMY